MAQDAGTNEGGVAEKIKAVEFEAEVLSVKSTVNQTYNLTLNVPEYCLPQIQVLMGWLKDQVTVAVINKTV